MIDAIKLFFSICFPVVAIFVLGAWTVVPEGVNEKLSHLTKTFSSILWFLMAGFFSIGLVGNISVIATNYNICETAQCLLQKPEILKISGWYFIPTLILYGLGCWFGVFASNYLRKNNV